MKDLKAQVALEYIFAFLMWLFICSIIYFALNPYIVTLTAQYTLVGYSETVQGINEVALSDVDGLRYIYVHQNINNTLSFNNTIAVLHTENRDIIIPSHVAYLYAEDFHRGDKFLIKNQDGEILIPKVS